MKRTRSPSSDDEDRWTHGVLAGLTRFATAATHTGHDNFLTEMGLPASSASSSSQSSTTLSEDEGGERPGMRRQRGTVIKSSGDDDVGTNGYFSHQVEDEDVPLQWSGLLSDALLHNYAVTLSHHMAGFALTDRLLAQYLPSKGERHGGGEMTPTDADRTGYVNRYAILPGWRWDGVLRGRQYP